MIKFKFYIYLKKLKINFLNILINLKKLSKYIKINYKQIHPFIVHYQRESGGDWLRYDGPFSAFGFLLVIGSCQASCYSGST